jgi:hypothetical protein
MPTKRGKIEKKHPSKMMREWRKGITATVKRYYAERKRKLNGEE